ncbi:MAG TPA: hypothetical protein PKD26_08310 [Pyrinomonadaceae bacterium]|nr:hypothetical protein [Pyrinomonadaceae bacterium]
MRNSIRFAGLGSIGMLVAAFCFVAIAADVYGQGTRRKRVPTASATPVPAPAAGTVQVISRADDYPEIVPVEVVKPEVKRDPDMSLEETDNGRSIAELRARVAGLESQNKNDRDEKQKRLLLNLDILNRAEQRSESLRKQLFDMIEKESTIKTKLDMIEVSIRPEAIEREVAFAGTLRPEALREMRKRQLEVERTNLQALLNEIQRTRTSLDQNLQRSESMVERLRTKLEKEIDDALADDPNNF